VAVVNEARALRHERASMSAVGGEGNVSCTAWSAEVEEVSLNRTSHPPDDLGAAWEASRLLLDAMGFRTYLFHLAVDEDDIVTIHVERPENGVWKRLELHATLEELTAMIDDRKQRLELAALWQQGLSEAA
jgi:hypothetical protein